MFSTFQNRNRNTCIIHFFHRVKQSQAKTNLKQTFDRDINLFFCDNSVFYRFDQCQISTLSAVQIGSMKSGIGCCRCCVRMGLMMIEYIINSATIRSDISLKIPFITQNRLHQQIIAATRLPLKSIVCTHHAGYLGINNQCTESRQISIPQIIGTYIRVEAMTVFLRSAMHGIVFGTSRGF